MDEIPIPEYLVRTCAESADRAAWLGQLPATIRHLRHKWSLTLARPFEADASASWVAPCVQEDGSPAVLKIGLPHMEAHSEIDGLLFWNGNPTVSLLESDSGLNAMLLERCLPGTHLRTLPEDEQDQVVAEMLKRLWRRPTGPHPFRELGEMIAEWNRETSEELERWPEPELAKEGIAIRKELAANAPGAVTLATDLHAGNILRAEREPWLVIDPKPFLGDPAYDATQHLLNCKGRLERDPRGTIFRFAELLEIDYQRIRLWVFARLASESDGSNQALARKVEQA